VVFSPASIGHAVLIAEGAADDTTRSAIAAAFDLPAGAHDARNRLDLELAASQTEQVTVTIADRIWPAPTPNPTRNGSICSPPAMAPMSSRVTSPATLTPAAASSTTGLRIAPRT